MCGARVAAGAAAGPAVPVPKRHLSFLSTRSAYLRAGKARRAIPVLGAPLHRSDLSLATRAARRGRLGAAGGSQGQQEVTHNLGGWRPARGQHRGVLGHSYCQAAPLGPAATDLLDKPAHRCRVDNRVHSADRSADRGNRVEEDL